MKAINIDWDVDHIEELETLPKEIIIPDGIEDLEDISDYISDKTGFCHLGFELEWITNKNCGRAIYCNSFFVV